ncbi:S-layer homology domain-containing protein [Agathobaculum sp.]|uniref:S-layer homology domain-containing protein n=2 Tax=Agathobaculum sp. TaxID=2048138 RepID=UPI003AF06E1B
MLKKNTRKRLLAGALATVMMLTMCPSWALADDEDIALLPANEEIAVPVVDSTPAADPTETPADPTPSETEAKPENQNTAPAPSGDEANGGTDSTESGNNNASSDASEDSKNNSQNNDVVSNSPESEISMASLDIDLAWNRNTKAQYFVLLPNRDKPTSGKSQGRASYLPNKTSDGGVTGRNAEKGYEGYLTPEGKKMADRNHSILDAKNGYTKIDGVESEYLEPPTNLGFFTKANWSEDGKTYNEKSKTTDPFSVLGENFNVNNIRVVWYTIKRQIDGYHVDGYVAGVPVKVTYHTNYAKNGITGMEETFEEVSATSGETYTVRDNTFTVPTGFHFDGWYTDKDCTKEYQTTTLMTSLDLYAKWTTNSTPVDPETKTPAKYFVLLPNLGTPQSGASQGWKNYLPNETSDGGVKGVSRQTGYEGSLTAAGRQAADRAYDTDDKKNGVFDDKGFGDDYLVPPTDLGFFDADNWSSDGTIYNSEKESNTTDPFSVLGENFNVKNNIRVVWYTIKYQGDEGSYHVDGYVDGVPVPVTYHSNFGTDVTEARTAKTGEVYNTVSYDELTELPSRPNYEFTGWYTDKECKQPYSPTLLMSSMDLYAGWKQTAFDVSYFYKDAQNVETQFGTTETYKVKSDVTVRTAHPEKEGYTFTGWTNIANIVTVDTTTGKFIMPAHHVRFDATFEINQYNVTYKVGTEVVGTDVYNFDADVAIRPVPTQEGYTFYGWTSKDSAFDIRGFKMPAHNVVIEGKFEKNPAKQYTYTVNKHFYNEKGVEVKVENGTPNPAVENTAVSELYKDAAVKQTVDGKTYVYVSGLTTVTDNLEKLTKDVTIDLYYYLNVEGGNDIPDAWEYRLTFKVVNGEWNDGGNADIVTYVQFKDQKTGEAFKDEAVVVPVTRIPAVGDKPNSDYHAGAWDTSPYDNYKVQKDTVFTYTYAKNSSGGSSGGHHRRPTVTIPDDVPTGLNGDDHYAYIVGYPDKTVRPQNGITRAEVATIFFRLLTDETRDANSTKSNSYSDVAAGAWYNHAVSTLSAMGIVKGDSNGKFNPNAPITRAEFAAIAARFDDKANSTTADFSDIVSHWAKNEISAASNNGWINGYPDGTFRPDNKITRAEAMTLVNRVLKRLPETAEDLHDDMIKWSDNSDASQWFYLAVQEATNSHYYKAKENKSEKWTELRDTRDWTELEK